MGDTRSIQDRPEILPGSKTDWWRAPAKDLRQARTMRDLESSKLEYTDTGSLGAITATNNDVLFYNGTDWVAVDKTALLSLDNLTDVSIAGAATGHILRYNGSAWVNVALAELISLTDLSDVTLTSPTTGAFLVKTSTDWIDQNYTPGKLGVGTSGDPTLRFELADSDHTAWFTGSADIASGTAGWRMSKDKTKTTKLLGYALHSDGAACWEWAMAGDTNNALRSGFGNADVGLWDYSAGGFALRVSPEEAASSGTGTKWFFGRNGTTPKAETGYVTMQSPANGLRTLVVRLKASQTAALTEWQDNSNNPFLSVAAGGHLTFAEAINVVVGTTTGTQIGTAPTQKLGLWGATPVVRPAAYTPTNVTTDRSYDANATTLDEIADVLGTLVSDLQSVGIIG